MTTYSIRDWKKHYENAASRKIQRHLSWVPVPTKHDGKGFRRLMARGDGPELYGAWLLIVQIAAKCEVRGVLADGGEPLTAEDMAFKTGAPISLFEKALQVLCSKEIGWLVCGNATSVLPEPAATLPEPPDALPPPALHNQHNQQERPAQKDQHGRAGAFTEITAEQLGDPEEVQIWIDKQLRKARPVIDSSEQARLCIHAAAVKATSSEANAADPVALFAHVVAGRKWSTIPDRDTDEARRRIRDIDERAKPPPLVSIPIREPPADDYRPRTPQEVLRQIAEHDQKP